MNDFTIGEMIQMQKELQERYQGKWEPICPEIGKNKLLWMLGEAGEVIDIVKKNGHLPVMEDSAIRGHFVEELADVLMYYNDLLLCYDISIEELKQAYTEKFHTNLNRWQ